MTQLIDEKQPATTCPVCGTFKMDFDDYCDACTEWKEKADAKRTAEARAKAFGSIL
jgi:hypothetical protein